jgi:predicted Ser/Thr protein kinase
MECPSCKTTLPEKARFCLECGTKAPESAQPAPEDPVRASLRKALGQQYEIARLLGRGGMGAVYLATEAALEREVAIKVLPPDRGATQESRDRFRREARTAAKLSHPNIVPLYTFGDVDGTLYFVMGYVKGESLAARLKREGRLAVEEARRILIEIADALDYAHKLGVIHRDIKPDNVLIEVDTGRALLTDFGIAKAVGAGQTMTELGSVLGTPQYMSPEQAQGKADIDHRTDLYSLGAMGYAMLAGRLPFEGGTPADIMVQHITKKAPSLKSLAPNIPVDIATALTKSLAKDPNSRYSDARSLKQAITISETDETPPELDGLGVFLVVPTVGAFILLCMAVWWLGGGDVSDPFPVMPAIVLTGASVSFLLLPFRWHHLRKRGFETDIILREILKPLQRFPGWRPRRLRPSGDVWDRLPPELRHLRQATGFLLLGAALIIPMLVFEAAGASAARRTGHRPFDSIGPGKVAMTGAAAIVLGLLVNGVSLFRFERFRRRHGLDSYAAHRLLEAPTSARLPWSKPEIAALLLPERSVSRNAGTAAPISASDLVKALTGIVGGLKEPARSHGEKAQAAAQKLAESISSLDRQVAGLERAFDPAEFKRLVTKLEALGPDRGADDEDRELREISRKQLDALVALETRLNEVRGRRDGQLELLKEVWVHTKGLESAAGDTAKAEIAISNLGRVLARIESADGTGAHSSKGSDVGFTESPTLER